MLKTGVGFYPLTIEGCAYDQVKEAVAKTTKEAVSKTTEIIEGISKLGKKG
jgi:hypothetical protein